MGLTVRFTQRALADLSDIRAYLVERSPQGAERVRSQIAATIDLLSSFPMIGRTTDEPGVRVVQLTRYPYRIFHVVETDAVVILHIRHSARESPSRNELHED
jgi:toxin ParE1/3/4